MTEQSATLKTTGLLAYIGVARASLYSLMKHDCTFPKPIRFGLRDNRWLRKDIDAWLNAKSAAANEVAA